MPPVKTPTRTKKSPGLSRPTQTVESGSSLVLPYRYTPRSYQRQFWDAMQKKKRAALIWHRRAGKDATAFNYQIYQACVVRPGIYYYIFPTYAQGKKILWDGINRAGMKVLDHVPKDLILNQNETEMKLTVQNINGGQSIIQVIGSDNIDSIVGTNPVGCVFSEYALQSPRAWDFIAPILDENGGWAIFAYTPRGKNHGYRLYQAAKNDPDEWFTSLLTIEHTRRDAPGEDGSPVIGPDAVERRRAEGMEEELIQQEYFCSFTGSLVGSYYGERLNMAEQEGRITLVRYEPSIPVDTAWDIGVGDSTAIWFSQSVGRDIRFIDYHEASGEGLPYYAMVLQDKKYLYGKHWAPHDIAVREWSSGHARIEAARQLGIKFIPVKKLSFDDGISAVRMLFSRFWFDEEKCARGLEALRSYYKEGREARRVQTDPCP